MITKLLLESRLALAALLVLVQGCLLALWWLRRGRFWAQCVWGGLVVSAAAITINLLVATPREQVIGLCQELAYAVDRGDLSVIARHLAEDFQAGGFEKQDFLDKLQRTITLFQVHQVRLRRFEVEFFSDQAPVRAVAVFGAVCQIQGPELSGDWLLSRWRLTFHEHLDAWKLARVEAVPDPFSPIHDVRQCLRW